MIKIKDYIFNENEIQEIEIAKKDLMVEFKSGYYEVVENATFEDIEWNYENFNDCKKLEEVILARDVKIKELEEENKKLKEQLLNYQVPPHNQKCYKTIPVEFTCTARGME